MSPDAAPMRVPTHVPGLDEVLGGGLLEGGLVLLRGPAGSGKTVLSFQIAFALASEGKRVTVISLLSETHARILQQLSTLGYFDPACLPDRLQLINGYDALSDRGTHGLLELVAQVFSKTRPTLAIVEGFGTLRTAHRSDLEIAEVTQRINSIASALGCTTLLLDTNTSEPSSPEHALVDGLIDLGIYCRGARELRELHVGKLRASNPMTGRHVFRIDGEGVTVFPRFEAAVQRRLVPASESGERTAFGVPTLDEMLGGGLVGGGTTLLQGAPGSGKTLLGLQFLKQGLLRGEPALYFGFYESPARLLAKAEAVGIHLRGDSGTLLALLWQPPLEYPLDELGYALWKAVRHHQPRRLVIDGLDGFHQCAMRPDRLPLFLTALTTDLRACNVSTVIIQEQANPPQSHPEQPYIVSALMENIITLRYVEARSQLQRLISIVKTRDSAFDSSIRKFRITTGGIQVSPVHDGSGEPSGHRADPGASGP